MRNGVKMRMTLPAILACVLLSCGAPAPRKEAVTTLPDKVKAEVKIKGGPLTEPNVAAIQAMEQEIVEKIMRLSARRDIANLDRQREIQKLMEERDQRMEELLPSDLPRPPRQATGTYRFMLDGKEIRPEILSLDGDPDHPRYGDVIEVAGIRLTIDRPGEYRFRSAPREDGRLFLALGQEKETVVGAAVRWTYQGERKVVFNPLTNLTIQEARQLRGVYLDEWPAGIEGRLKTCDLERLCLTVTDNVAQGDARALPPLPANLQYLVIDERSSDGIKDYGSLDGCASLVFVRLHRLGRDGFDIARLQRNRNLRFLGLTGNTVVNGSLLASFVALRSIDLSFAEGVEEVGWAGGLSALQAIDVACTPVKDLSPLEGAKGLRTIVADLSAVEKLPGGSFPRMVKLSVLTTRLSDEAVAAFARENPGCAVAHRWGKALAAGVGGATRIRVRSGGTCHRDSEEERTLGEERDPAEIAKAIAMIVIDEDETGLHCMCCGEPTIEFYRDEALIAVLGVHHGEILRWPGGWPADARLTAESAAALNAWLAGKGAKPARDE